MLQEKTELTPDLATITAHLRHITRRWGELDGQPVLEVVFLSAADVAEVKNVQRFPPTDLGIADAAEHIAGMNRHKLNAYAVVNPVDGAKPRKTGERASGQDIMAAFFHWADADDGQAAENIRNFVGPKCTFHVLTGTKPTNRPHVYWELEEPALNLPAWTETQRAIAATLKTDRAVVDPPRIMRIGGSINWPKPQKIAKGYIAEMTSLRVYDPVERPPVSSDRMSRAFLSAAPAQTAGLQIDTGQTHAPALDREQLRIQALNGQEWHHAVVKLVGSYVAKGLSDSDIHTLTQPLTLAGYTGEQTAREVQTAIDGARRKGWTPQAYASLEQSAAEPDAQFDAPARPMDLEWFSDAAPRLAGAYIVKGVIDAGAMSVVYGPSNSGKTFFAFDLAFHIAAGVEWRGRRVTQAAVLYLAAEGGRGAMNRMAALRITSGVHDVPFALKRAGLDLLHDQADLQHIADLAREVSARLPDAPLLVVIDTLSRIMAGGDENSAADMTALIRNIDAVREATGAHIMLVHHTGKDTARGARGHSSLRAATDTEIEVGNDAGARAAMVTKQRDHQGGETFAFALKSVRLGHDQDGDEVTSCVVEVVDEGEYNAAAKSAKGLGGNQKLIAETFDQMLSDGLGKPNPGGTGMPDSGRFWTVGMEDLRDLARSKMVATDTRSAFNQAMKALIMDRGLFVSGGNLVWRIDRETSKNRKG